MWIFDNLRFCGDGGEVESINDHASEANERGNDYGQRK
jgi:hypothetical protein